MRGNGALPAAWRAGCNRACGARFPIACCGWAEPDGRIATAGAAMMPSGAPLAPAAADTLACG